VRICVLGTHSFRAPGPKIGTQHIAQTLARRGHEVHYLTSQASAATLILPGHRRKYLRSFQRVLVEPGLLEVTPVAPLPARALLRLERGPLGAPLTFLTRRLERTRHRFVERQTYDVCVFSAAANMTLLPRINAHRYVYRQNDLLREFAAVPESLLRFERHVLRDMALERVCPVNERLAEFCRSVNPALPILVVPNGLDLALFDRAVPDATLAATREANVVYVGAVEFWVDVELILRTAELMPDRRFHVFGPWHVRRPTSLPANVTLHGPIAHDAVPAVMRACSVGIIPSSAANAPRMVEKPLKFYEYLAAGLGVAATPFAGEGLAPLAEVGGTPGEFAAAIERAAAGRHRLGDAIRAAVEPLDWSVLVPRIVPGA